MPRPRPLYVEQQITRHGRKVWYFRKSRNEPRQRLPDAYGSEEFMAAYRACLAGQPVAVQGRRKASRGTVEVARRSLSLKPRLDGRPRAGDPEGARQHPRSHGGESRDWRRRGPRQRGNG